MQWIEDFNNLKSRGLKPRIWVQCKSGKEIEFTDGYVGNTDPESVEGYNMFLTVPDWASGEPIKFFTDAHFEIIKDLNSYLYEEGTPTFDTVGRCKMANLELKNLDGFCTSKTGIVYKPNKCKLREYDLTTVFKPIRSVVEGGKYGNRNIALIDGCDYRRDFNTAVDYPELMAYTYLPEVEECLQEVDVIYIAARLAFPQSNPYEKSQCEYIESNEFDFSMVTDKTDYAIKTDGGVILLEYYCHLDEVQKRKDGLKGTIEEYLLDNFYAMDSEHEYTDIFIRGNYCSKFSYKGGVLDVRICSIISIDNTYQYIVDIPLHLVYPTNLDTVDKGRTSSMVYNYGRSAVTIPYSLLKDLDTSLDLEDVLPQEALDKLTSLSDYKRVTRIKKT